MESLGKVGRIYEIDTAESVIHIFLWRKIEVGDLISVGDKVQNVDSLELGGEKVKKAMRGQICGVKIHTFNVGNIISEAQVHLLARR